MNSNTSSKILRQILSEDRIKKLLDSDVKSRFKDKSIEEIIEIFTSQDLENRYTYESSKKDDNFLYDTPNLLVWYNTKNPEFLRLSELNSGNGPNMPEFHTLIMTILLNILKTIGTYKFPRRNLKGKTKKQGNTNITLVNTENKLVARNQRSWQLYEKSLNSIEEGQKWVDIFKTLLSELLQINMSDNTRNDYYSYKKIMLLYLKYIAIMSGINILHYNLEDPESIYKELQNPHNTSDLSSCLLFLLYIYDIFLKTPFIIFPTFRQVIHSKVIKTISAPVINFNIAITRTESHGSFISPCDEIEHDLAFHGAITHLQLLINNYEPSTTFTAYRFHWQDMHGKYQLNYNEIKDKLKYIYNEILNPFFMYALDYRKENEKENEMLLNIFFLLFHEHVTYFKIIFYGFGSENNTKNLFTINDFLKNMYAVKKYYYDVEIEKRKQSNEANSVTKFLEKYPKEKDNKEFEILKKCLIDYSIQYKTGLNVDELEAEAETRFSYYHKKPQYPISAQKKGMELFYANFGLSRSSYNKPLPVASYLKSRNSRTSQRRTWRGTSTQNPNKNLHWRGTNKHWRGTSNQTSLSRPTNSSSYNASKVAGKWSTRTSKK